MYCDVKDPACAAMLERVCYKQFASFIAETEEDASFIKHELRAKMRIGGGGTVAHILSCNIIVLYIIIACPVPNSS